MQVIVKPHEAIRPLVREWRRPRTATCGHRRIASRCSSHRGPARNGSSWPPRGRPSVGNVAETGKGRVLGMWFAADSSLLAGWQVEVCRLAGFLACSQNKTQRPTSILSCGVYIQGD